jgi:hypothetical protein
VLARAVLEVADGEPLFGQRVAEDDGGCDADDDLADGTEFFAGEHVRVPR